MKTAGQKTKAHPARQSYDRLVGPLRLVPLEGQWGLAPDVRGSAWRIENVGRGRQQVEVLYRRVAALDGVGAERICDEAGKIGALGPPGAAAEEERARELLRRLRLRLEEGPPSEPATPLVTYPDGHDRRVFARMSESLLETLRDGGATRDIVGAIEHYLDGFELVAPDHAAIATQARAVAAKWRPELGCARLYQLVCVDLRARGQRPLDVLWPRVVALILIQRRGVPVVMAWRALAMLTPLLLAIVDPQSARDPRPERDDAWTVAGASCQWPKRDFYARVRSEPVGLWLHLAYELRAWRDVLDELRKGGLGRRLAGVERMRAAFDTLAGVVSIELGDIRVGGEGVDADRYSFERVDATKSSTLWQKFSQLSSERIAKAGLTKDRVPFGALLGTRGHALLAIERAFHAAGLCRCGAQTGGGLCESCERREWRDSKRRQRAGKGGTARRGRGTDEKRRPAPRRTR